MDSSYCCAATLKPSQTQRTVDSFSLWTVFKTTFLLFSPDATERRQNILKMFYETKSGKPNERQTRNLKKNPCPPVRLVDQGSFSDTVLSQHCTLKWGSTQRCFRGKLWEDCFVAYRDHPQRPRRSLSGVLLPAEIGQVCLQHLAPSTFPFLVFLLCFPPHTFCAECCCFLPRPAPPGPHPRLQNASILLSPTELLAV